MTEEFKEIKKSALFYESALGLKLVRLKPKSKRPAGKKWQLTPAYNFNSHDNIGVDLGKSKVCSLDIDCMKSFEIVLSKMGYEMPEGPKIQGSSKGVRYLFKLPEGLEPSHKHLKWIGNNNKNYTVFELRAAKPEDNRQDVLPPSIHPETLKPYVWLTPPDKTLPEPPEWIIELWKNWDCRVEEMKALAPNYEPPKPKNRKEKRVIKQLLENDSVIDQWNRAHDIESTLEAYDYKRRGKDFVSPHSTTAKTGGGAVVIFSDNKCYIHSTSDPLYEERVPRSPFDFYLHYKHGGNYKIAVAAAAKILGIDHKSSQKKSLKSLYCKETKADYYDNYPNLEARKEEGRNRQCEKFTFLILQSMIHRIGRSINSIYETAKEYCKPSKELIEAVEIEIKKRDIRALSNQSLTYDYYFERDENNYLNLEEAHKVGLKSRKKMIGYRFDYGSNKTQGIALQTAQEMGSSLWISHRAILAVTTAKKITSKGGITLASYQEVRANASFHVSTCINSIINFKDQQAKVLIIDEAAQVLTHFEGDAWNSEPVRKEALEILKEVAQKADKIILLDADLTDHHMKAWSEILNCDYLVIESEASKVKRDVEIIYSASPIRSRNHALLEMIVSVQQGLKILVPCESCDAAKALERDLKKKGAKVLSLHRETPSDVKEAFSSDPDKYISEHKPDVMIYTSLIGSGVSMEGNYFDMGICLFGGNMLTPEDYLQMMRRYRELIKFKVFYSQGHKDKNRFKPIFDGFNTNSVDDIKLTTKKLKTHNRVYNEVIFEHLLRERNFNVSTRNDHQYTTGTKTKEIKEEEAEEILNAIPKDIIPNTPEEHRQAQAWEIMTWLGRCEKTYKPELSNCLKYRTDKMQFKRECMLTGTLEVYESYQAPLIEAQLLYPCLVNGVDENELKEFFSRVWELKEFLTILDLLPQEWIMRDCKQWPKKRLIQAAKTLSDYWGISQVEEPKPKPISAKKAQLASELAQVEVLFKQGLGMKKIATATGLKRSKVQRFKKMILERQGIENQNNSQSIYKTLGDNPKNDPLAERHHYYIKQPIHPTENALPVSQPLGSKGGAMILEPAIIGRSTIGNCRIVADTHPMNEHAEIPSQATFEGTKAEPFIHYAHTSEPLKEIAIKYDPACPNALESLSAYAPSYGRIEAIIETSTRTAFLSRKASNDPLYLADWVGGIVGAHEHIKQIRLVTTVEHWPETINWLAA
jgi:hypothetical protein